MMVSITGFKPFFTQRRILLNIQADYHVHTSFSGDCNIAPRIMIERALSLGLTHLCLTDHMDYDYTDGNLCFEFDPKVYFEQLLPLKEEFADRIDLRIGIELGLQPYLTKKHHNLIFSYPFDFVIGSVHLVNGKDPYYPVFFEGKKESTAYEEYFECCIQNLESYSNFDTFGHLDYIVRYGPNKNKYYSFERYQKYIDGILRRLIRYNIGLEVNTGGYKYSLGTTNPCREIVLRYRELGGTIITFGSDAHDPKYLTYEFEKAAELVRSCGFHSYYIFKNRKPVELPL